MASRWLIETIPFIFGSDIEDFILWKEELSQKIGVDSRAITLIGSCCVGFSLNPHKNFQQFDSESDIDVAVISYHHFELAWHWMRNLGASIYSLTQTQRNSVEDHVKRLIYWGAIAADRILPVLPFGKEWTIALSQMAQLNPSEGRVINIRIYKDFESLRAYHVNNLLKIRGEILSAKPSE